MNEQVEFLCAGILPERASHSTCPITSLRGISQSKPERLVKDHSNTHDEYPPIAKLVQQDGQHYLFKLVRGEEIGLPHHSTAKMASIITSNIGVDRNALGSEEMKT